VSVSVSVSMSVSVSVSVSASVSMSVCACARVRVRVCMHACGWERMCTFVCMRAWVCVCRFVCRCRLVDRKGTPSTAKPWKAKPSKGKPCNARGCLCIPRRSTRQERISEWRAYQKHVALGNTCRRRQHMSPYPTCRRSSLPFLKLSLSLLHTHTRTSESAKIVTDSDRGYEELEKARSIARRAHHPPRPPGVSRSASDHWHTHHDVKRLRPPTTREGAGRVWETRQHGVGERVSTGHNSWRGSSLHTMAPSHSRAYERERALQVLAPSHSHTYCAYTH